MTSRTSYEYADADGNRGMWETNYIWDKEDYKEAAKQIVEAYPDGDYPDTVMVYLWDEAEQEEVEFEEDPKDYLDLITEYSLTKGE